MRDVTLDPLDAKGLRRRVRVAVSRLPDDLRDVAKLRFGLVGGRALTQREAAETLGISRRAVQCREARACRLLRELMARDQ